MEELIKEFFAMFPNYLAVLGPYAAGFFAFTIGLKGAIALADRYVAATKGEEDDKWWAKARPLVKRAADVLWFINTLSTRK